MLIRHKALKITKRDLTDQVYLADVPTYDKRRGRIISQLPIRLPAEIVHEHFLKDPAKAPSPACGHRRLPCFGVVEAQQVAIARAVGMWTTQRLVRFGL